MKIVNSLLVVALGLGGMGVLATGCATDAPASMAGDDDGGGGDDSGGGGGKTPAKPLDATGMYTMRSTFDLATNMPSTAGTVVNTIIAATHGDDQPTRWILGQLVLYAPSNYQTALSVLVELAAPPLNRRLLEFAPDFLSTILQAGNDFGNIAKQFGLTATFELTRAGTGYVAVHTITGAHFKLDGEDGDYLLANYNVPNIVVGNVAVTMDVTGQLSVGAHRVSVPYGDLLRVGLDAAIIPLLDPAAHNLNELLLHKINCQRLAELAHDELPVLGTSTYKSLCESGINAGANFVYSKIDDVDGSALELDIHGTARGSDRNADKLIDTIQTGTWAGTLSYAGSPTPLIPAAFFGERQ